MFILLAARASRIENQDAIDASIVGMLGDPKEARAGLTEVHSLPFKPVDKGTAITYIDTDGNWHRCSKGAPEQTVPEKTKESAGGPWEFVGFLVAQLIATLIAALYASWGFAPVKGIGWGWAAVIWIYTIIAYIPLDILKFLIRHALSRKAWDNILQNKTAFTTKKDCGREEREAQWATAQRTLHGLQPPKLASLFEDNSI